MTLPTAVTSVMFYIAFVHRKHFVYIIKLYFYAIHDCAMFDQMSMIIKGVFSH